MTCFVPSICSKWVHGHSSYFSYKHHAWDTKLLILIQRLDQLHNSSSLHLENIVDLSFVYQNIFKDSSFLKQFHMLEMVYIFQTKKVKQYSVSSRVWTLELTFEGFSGDLKEIVDKQSELKIRRKIRVFNGRCNWHMLMTMLAKCQLFRFNEYFTLKIAMTGVLLLYIRTRNFFNSS